MEAANRLVKIISEVEQKISTFSEEEWNTKPNPAKWSKKEILGHLIDSEYNNHVRAIKSVATPEPLVLENYVQDEWVRRNSYQNQSYKDIFAGWKLHQNSMVNLMKNISESEFDNPVIVKGETKTLKFLLDDYVDHLVHHLKQIFGNDFTG